MDKIKTIFKKNNCLISFFLGSVCMYMILSYAGVLRTGKYCILEGDLFEIYIPVIRNFCRNILHGQSIYYSWNNSLGMNTSVMLSFYGAFNPFNILYLVFHKADPNIITALIVILKVGLAALSFQLFEKMVLKVDGFMSVIFSVLYSLCSFQVAYGIVNIIWTDSLYVLPLVFISFYILREKGNLIPLTLSYAYIFIVQPYMGFVIGFFSFIYFVISIFLTRRKILLYKYIFGFAISVVTAILISSVTWLPALYQLIKSGIASSEGFVALGINPLDVYNQLFFGNNNSIVECMPNIYCGVLSLILLPIFFIDKRNDVKSKIKGGILLLILVLSCVILPIYKVWCVFDAPDGWPFRFSFCFSFVIVTLAALESKHLKEINFKILFIVACADLGIYILEIFLLNSKRVMYSINNLLYLMINIFIIFIWIGLFFLFKKYSKDEKKINGLSLLFVLIACFECVGNGYSAYYKGNNYYTVPETRETQFYSWYENQKQLIDFLDSDNSFYRVNFMGDYLNNSDTFSGYNGISDFSTSENINVRYAMKNMGFATSRKVIRNFGITPVTKMLLGVKYDVDCFLPYVGSSNIPPIDINTNDYALSLGFLVDEDILDFSFNSNDAFNNLNSLISCMIGKNCIIFQEIEKDKILIENEGLCLNIADSGYVVNNYSQDENSFLSFTTGSEYQEDDVFMYFENFDIFSQRYSMVLSDGFENRSEAGGVLSRSYIKKFEDYNEINGNSKKIYLLSNGILNQTIKDYYIAKFDKELFFEIYKELSNEQLLIDKYTNTYINGIIEAKEDNEILFTSIPFDKGWKIKIDEKETDTIPILDGAFIGVRIPKGTHNIEFKYVVSGLKEGVILSLLGLLVLLIIYLYTKLSLKMIINNND